MNIILPIGIVILLLVLMLSSLNYLNHGKFFPFVWRSRINKESKITQKCYHEVPCTCDEYLNRLTQKELMNLRIQFGTVITDAQRACAGKRSIPVLNNSRREAVAKVTKINQVLERKFGYIVI